MSSFERPLGPGGRGAPRRPTGRLALAGLGLGGLVATLVVVAVVGMIAYNSCRLEVGTGEQAVLIRKTGLDLAPDMEIAPAPQEGAYYKGVQPGVVTEGRYFYNPFYWDWEIGPQHVVKAGHCGVIVALAGEELPTGRILAGAGQKGIRPSVLESGARVAFNKYAEVIEEFPLVIVPPGFRGVVTLLDGATPKDPNVVLVDKGERGVQKETLAAGTYAINPYERRISIVDCRTQRFNLNQDDEMSFLSADGFTVTLDGVISFRVQEDKAAEVYVLYNEDDNGDAIDTEIINKIITPESRSICRVNGSKLTGGQFISGDDRGVFQTNLERSLKSNCAQQGIEILNVSITSILPPPEIIAPVQAREVAKQQLVRFQQETLREEAQAQVRIKMLEAEQQRALIEAQQEIVEKVTMAEQRKQLAVTQAERDLSVAQTNLSAAEDKASVLEAEAKAAADVIRFKNEAEVAGLTARVTAFEGDGQALAQNVLMSKLAPSFRTILSNSEGPLMELFNQFTAARPSPTRPTPTPTPAAAATPEPPAAPVAELPAQLFSDGGEVRP